MSKYPMVGLSADWSVEAWLIGNNGKHDVMVFDRDDTGMFYTVVLVNPDTNGSEDLRWFDSVANWNVVATFKAMLDADMDTEGNKALSRVARDKAIKFAEELV